MLASERIVNGSYGELWENGEWQDNINAVTAEVTINKSALNLSGGRWQKHKITSITGSGTISGFKVSSNMIKQSQWVMDDQAAPVSTEFLVYLKDPEAYGHECVKLKGIKFDRVQLANWTAGQEVAEETPFTFEGYELVNEIVKGD